MAEPLSAFLITMLCSFFKVSIAAQSVKERFDFSFTNLDCDTCLKIWSVSFLTLKGRVESGGHQELFPTNCVLVGFDFPWKNLRTINFLVNSFTGNEMDVLSINLGVGMNFKPLFSTVLSAWDNLRALRLITVLPSCRFRVSLAFSRPTENPVGIPLAVPSNGRVFHSPPLVTNGYRPCGMKRPDGNHFLTP